jgi:hypothetical protein
MKFLLLDVLLNVLTPSQGYAGIIVWLVGQLQSGYIEVHQLGCRCRLALVSREV